MRRIVWPAAPLGAALGAALGVPVALLAEGLARVIGGNGLPEESSQGAAQ